MAGTGKAHDHDPKSLPRPQYLPEFGRPEKKPRRPDHVLPLPPGIYLTETGERRKTEKT